MGLCCLFLTLAVIYLLWSKGALKIPLKFWYTFNVFPSIFPADRQVHNSWDEKNALKNLTELWDMHSGKQGQKEEFKWFLVLTCWSVKHILAAQIQIISSHNEERAQKPKTYFHIVLGVLAFIRARVIYLQLSSLPCSSRVFHLSCCGSVPSGVLILLFSWPHTCKPSYCCHADFAFDVLLVWSFISRKPTPFLPLGCSFWFIFGDPIIFRHGVLTASQQAAPIPNQSMHRWTTDILYLDFRKAFDIFHNILSVLERYGFHGGLFGG